MAYRPKCLQWMYSNYKLEYNDAEDVFQKSFIILYRNVRNGKLEQLHSTLETYFYGIAKNVLKDQQNTKYKHVIQFPEHQKELESLDLHQKSEEESHRTKYLGKLLEQVGEPCKSILKYFYFDRFSMEAIANRIGYKNEAVATKKKYQCILKIRSLLDKNKMYT